MDVPTNIQLSVGELDYNGGSVSISLDIKEEKDVVLDPYYRLYLLGKNSMYPGLFYNIELNRGLNPCNPCNLCEILK